MIELMPTFENEEEFNKYFERENKLCGKYAGEDAGIRA